MFSGSIYELSMEIFQIFWCLVIIWVTFALYKGSESKIIKDRFIFFGITFLLFTFLNLLHIFRLWLDVFLGSTAYANLLIHMNNLLFTIFLATVLLLNFVRSEHIETIKKICYASVLSLVLVFGSYIFYTTTFLDKSLVFGLRPRFYSDAFQVLIIGITILLALKKMVETHSLRGVLTLHKKYPVHRRYPFVLAVFLLGTARTIHVFNYFFGKDILFLSQHILVSFFLLIIASKLLFTYLHTPSIQDDLDEWIKNGKNVLERIVQGLYYSLPDVGMGEREIKFDNFLKKSSLTGIFDHNTLQIKEEEFHRSLERDPIFILNVAEGMLLFFKENVHYLNKRIIFWLLEYLRITNNNNTFRRNTFDQRKHEIHSRLWKYLSDIHRTNPDILEENINKLNNWNSSTTHAFFEEKHSTGIEKLDEKTGKIPTRSLTLNIKKAEIDKKYIFNPIVFASLNAWKNVILMSTDPIEKTLSALGNIYDSLYQNRLKIISLSPNEQGIVKVKKNCFVINESSKAQLKFLLECIDDFVLSSIILVADFNPIVINEAPKDLYYFLSNLKELCVRKNITVYSCISEGVNPENTIIVQDNADVVIKHEVIDGTIYSSVLKPHTRKDEKGITLRKELYDLLSFINRENSLGRTPSYTEVMNKFSISAVTSRKRINELESKRLLRVKKIGRSKTLEITEKGKEVLFNTIG